MGGQGFDDRRTEAKRRAARLRAVALHEVLQQQRDVLRPLAQGRQVHVHHVQPVVQVLAKLARLDHLLQRTVGRRDHAQFHAVQLGASDASELLLLKQAQQLDLRLWIQLADLVQEEGPAVRGLDQSLATPRGSGEGSALVAEELALHQVRRNRRAVHGHEGAPASGAGAVQRLSHDLFARAALSRDQHAQVGRPDPTNQLAKPLDGRALTHDGALALLPRRAQTRTKRAVFPCQTTPLHRTVDAEHQVIR